MIVLDKEIYFWLLTALIPILIVFTIFWIWRKKRMENFANAHAWQHLSTQMSKRKIWIKLVLFSTIWMVGVVALVNPKVGSKLKTISREGIDIVFVLDVSKSMLAEDSKPSRLEKSKGLVGKMLDEFVSDRVGIVVYAGLAYPQLPLTTDYSSAKMFLKNIDTDIVPSHGTDVEAAINMALDYYKNTDEKNNRTIILISDGEDHENTNVNFAKRAKSKGINIHTIALGSPKGAPIPIKDKYGKVIRYKKDADDEVVITKMNPSFLKKIASVSNGSFVDGNNTKTTINHIKNELNKIEKGESETELFEDYDDQFQWFIGLALILLTLDIFMRKGKTNWLRKINN
jgi:Ca-activated chloride channel family protein